MIREEDLPRESRAYLGGSNSDRIDTMVRGVINQSLGSESAELSFGDELEFHIVQLRDFLYDRVYDSPLVHQDFLKCSRIIEDLYHYFLRNADVFLDESGLKDFYDEPAACVCDFVAGMTDRYAFNLFERFFLPLPWKIQV